MNVNYWSSTKKIQLKENSTENSAVKNLKEDSKLMNSETFRWNKKEKKKTQIQRTLFSWNSLREVPANCSKVRHTLSFLSFSFLFLLYKIPF